MDNPQYEDYVADGNENINENLNFYLRSNDYIINFFTIRSIRILVEIICKGRITNLYLGIIETIEKIIIITKKIKIK